MKIKISKILPVGIIYLGLILLFFFYFLERIKTETTDIEGIAVYEKYMMATPSIPRKIKRLDLNHSGITLSFSQQNPLLIYTDDNIRHKAYVESYEQAEESLFVYFTNHVTLMLRPDEDASLLTIIADIPKTFPAINTLVLPMKVMDDYSFEETELTYKISRKEEEYHLKLNENYSYSPEKKTITLSVANDHVPVLTIAPLAASEVPVAEKWYSLGGKNIKTNLSSSQADFIKKSYRAWQTRFNTQTGRWKMKGSSESFSEEALAAYLAETARDGKLTIALQRRLLNLQKTAPSHFSHLTAPYIGDIVNKVKKWKTEEAVTIKNLNEMIRSGNISLFDTNIADSIIPKLITRNIPEMSVQNISEETPLNNLYNRLNFLVTIANSGQKEQSITNAIKSVTDIMMQKLQFTEETIFFADNNRADLFKNFQTALLIIKASEYHTNEFCKPVGEAVIHNILNLSDNQGFIPANYSFDDSSYSESYIGPEKLYPYITDNPNVAKEKVFGNVTAWSMGNNFHMTITDKEVNLKSTFPKGQVEYLAVSGIKPLTPTTVVRFHNLKWRPDRNFQKYEDGYYYDVSSQTLYIAIKHKTLTETMRIMYE